jgi:hypothetical protein
VVSWLKKNTPGRIRKGDNPNRRIQDTDKMNLLCNTCEKMLSKWETAFAEKVFIPVHSGALAQGPISYGPWAMKCLASISWRVLLFHSLSQGLPNLRDQHVIEESKRALERLRLFIMNEIPSPEPYFQHLLPMEIIEDHTLPTLSPFMNRNASMVDSARWPCTIQACADRSIPGTFERSARSLPLRNRVWNIPFDADGRLSDLTGDFHQENAAPSTKYGRAELTVEAFESIYCEYIRPRYYRL